MTLDEYVAWAAGIGMNQPADVPEDRTLLKIGLGFVSEIGEVAGVLTRWLRDDERRHNELADELGDVVYYWAGYASSPEWCRPRCSRAAGRISNGTGPAARQGVRHPQSRWPSKNTQRGRWDRAVWDRRTGLTTSRLGTSASPW
jgi:hypothetical protein